MMLWVSLWGLSASKHTKGNQENCRQLLRVWRLCCFRMKDHTWLVSCWFKDPLIKKLRPWLWWRATDAHMHTVWDKHTLLSTYNKAIKNNNKQVLIFVIVITSVLPDRNSVKYDKYYSSHHCFSKITNCMSTSASSNVLMGHEKQINHQ